MKLWRRIKHSKKNIRDEYTGEHVLPLRRSEIGSRINDEVMAKLDELRKRKS